MFDLSAIEKHHLEQVLEIGDGYVLGFSNRTFKGFVLDSLGREIYDEQYNSG